jgi:hypothetical protein
LDEALTYTFNIKLIAEAESDLGPGAGSYILGLSSSAVGDGDAEAIIFSSALNDESQAPDDMPYSVTIEPGGNTVGAALNSCRLVGRRIYISFTPQAAALWDADADVVLELGSEVTDAQVDLFRRGIRRIVEFCTDAERPSLIGL